MHIHPVHKTSSFWQNTKSPYWIVFISDVQIYMGEIPRIAGMYMYVGINLAIENPQIAKNVHILALPAYWRPIYYKTRGLSAWQLRCLIVYATLNDVYLSMIHSQINTQWSWFDLSMPPKVTCHGVNWTIYDLLYVFHAKFDKKILHLGDTTLLKSCDLDLTLKGYPMSNVSR